MGRGGGCITKDFFRFPMDLGGSLARGFILIFIIYKASPEDKSLLVGWLLFCLQKLLLFFSIFFFYVLEASIEPLTILDHLCSPFDL